jgi:hypothetical protein
MGPRALQFVLNYEEGGENNVLHGDAGSETFLSEIIGAASFSNRHMSMESPMSMARAPVCGVCCACSRSASCR